MQCNFLWLFLSLLPWPSDDFGRANSLFSLSFSFTLSNSFHKIDFSPVTRGNSPPLSLLYRNALQRKWQHHLVCKESGVKMLWFESGKMSVTWKHRRPKTEGEQRYKFSAINCSINLLAKVNICSAHEEPGGLGWYCNSIHKNLLKSFITEQTTEYATLTILNFEQNLFIDLSNISRWSWRIQKSVRVFKFNASLLRTKVSSEESIKTKKPQKTSSWEIFCNALLHISILCSKQINSWAVTQ